MAKQQGEALFKESSRGKVGFAAVFFFLLAMVLMFGGMVVASYGFNAQLTETEQLGVFTGGMLAIILGTAVGFGGRYATTVKLK